jgi:hypothetical protein
MDIISEENESNISIDDINVFYKERFINLSNINNTLYMSLSKVNIPDTIKYIGKVDSYDIWYEKKYKLFLIGLPNSPTKSWYKIKNINDIDVFITFFSSEKMDLYNEISFIINLNSQNKIENFEEFTRYIYLHEFTEKQIFETKRDMNHMIKNNKLIYDDEIKILNNFIQSKMSSFFIRLKYSKSIIYCESYNNINNDKYILVKLYYNDLKMRNRYAKWLKNIPSDCSILFSTFNITFCDDLIDNINTLDYTNENITLLDALFNIYTDRLKLKKRINIKKIKSNDISEYISKKLNNLDSDELFNKIIKDGMFKAFENSFDILLETFYDKINNNENENVRTNIMYFNEKLKNKIDDIFKSKLI